MITDQSSGKFQVQKELNLSKNKDRHRPRFSSCSVSWLTRIGLILRLIATNPASHRAALSSELV